MKRMIFFYCMSIILLLGLPGCGRLIDWGKDNFYQGEQVDSYSCEAKPYIRSATIYNQFTTKATFDVMWLSNEVREAYVQLHVARQGKNVERQNALLRRQLEENNHYISFYVFSLHEVKLGDSESQWSLFLRVNDELYQPMEIKEIELPYEYQIFFGDVWNRFKVPYLVRFNAKDSNDVPLITEKTESLALYVRSANKEHDFVWHLHSDEPEVEIKACKKRKRKRRQKSPAPAPLRKKRRGKRT